MTKNHHRRLPSPTYSRNAIATIWMILVVPAMMTLLCVAVDVANLWLARVELKNALEAAAVAAVNEWGDAGGVGTTLLPRNIGIAFGMANRVGGESLMLTDNRDPGNSPNENASCTGNLVFGATTNAMPPFTFDTGVTPDCGAGNAFAVRAQATISVKSLFGSPFGVSSAPYHVSAQATARYDCATGKPVLVHIGSFLCPP